MKPTNGTLEPKPFVATPAQLAEADELGISSTDYGCARGGGLAHDELVTFAKQHSDAPDLGDALYWWGFALVEGATVSELVAFRLLTEAAGKEVDYEGFFDAMS